MESEKSGFVNEMSEIWRKMQVNLVTQLLVSRLSLSGSFEFAIKSPDKILGS